MSATPETIHEQPARTRSKRGTRGPPRTDGKITTRKGGRPRVPVDVEKVKALCQIGCTAEEIAAVLGVDDKTIARRFGAAIKTGLAMKRASLKRTMHRLAMAGNIPALIFTAKQPEHRGGLGWKDSDDDSRPPGSPGDTVVFAQVIIEVDDGPPKLTDESRVIEHEGK